MGSDPDVLSVREAGWHAGSRRILGGVSFDVRPGEFVALMGRNGAGKSTLLDLIAGVRQPSEGTIAINDRPLPEWPARDLARTLSHLPQMVRADVAFSVEQLVLMGRYPHAPSRFFETETDAAVAREAMAATGTLALAALPLEQLSGGERQRAMLARALAQEPRLLVLDEPTSHLDLRYQAETAELLRRLNRERGVTILLVSHDLNLAAELCDRLLLLHEGRVAAVGTPADVLDQSRLEHVFDCRVVVDKSATGRPTVQLAWPARDREATR